MTRRSVPALLIVAVVGVLGYGYWFGATHGALMIYAVDTSDREHHKDLTPVTVTFLDTGGRALAEARTIPPYGTIFVTAPPEYACYEIEQRAPFDEEARKQWTECFERQSRWLPTWIRSAAAVNLQSGSCRVQRLPISVAEYPDTWYLWWVPLRHVGGRPYTSFGVNIRVDRSARCPGSS
jgi:hypothetical protein